MDINWINYTSQITEIWNSILKIWSMQSTLLIANYILFVNFLFANIYIY